MVFPWARGGKFKDMSYRYHCDNHSKVMVAAGVPEWFSNDNVHEKWALTCSDRLWARSTRVPPTKSRAK